MIITFLQRLLWLAALVAAQMVVFNYMHFFGYATPLPFVYLLLIFPMDTQRWTILLWGFACGLLSDIVSLTPGIGAASMTLAAFIQPPLLALMAPKDSAEDLEPSYASLGFWQYVRYASIITFIFCAAYFLLSSFNFFHVLDLAISFVSSWVLTLVLCLLIEGVRKKKSSTLS